MDEDHAVCENTCLAILRWCGVSMGNKERIKEMGNDLCEYLANMHIRLSEDLVLGEHYIKNETHINAGFTKIYALLLDDFIIYDDRGGRSVGFSGPTLL